MTKFILRTTLFVILTCVAATTAKAQIGYDYAQYDLGVSVGFNQFYGDVVTPKATNAVTFNFNYNQGPFTNLIFEAQFGKLAGGDATKDYLGRQFSSDYQYYAMRLQLQAGEIIDYSQSPFFNAIKNFYIGAGIGIVFDNVTSINRYSTKLPGYYTPGLDKANQTFLPARIGYEFKIYNKYQQPGIKIDIGYQQNIIFGDEIDGFQAGAHNDSYGQFTIGAKFSIGGVTSYRKQITYFKN